MKLSQSTRVIAETLGFVLAALFAFALAMLIERLFWGYSAHYSFAVRAWPLLLAYLGGRLSCRFARKPARLLVLVLSGAAALGLLWLLVRPDSFAAWLCWGLSALPAALLGVVGSRSVPVYPQSVAVASVCLYLFEVVFFAVSFGMDDPTSPLCVCAMVNFLLCLYSANVKGMYDGLHVREKAGVRPSRSLRRGNTLVLTGFILLTVAVALTGLVRKGMSLAFSAVVWLLSLLPRASGETGAPVPMDMGGGGTPNLAALDAPEMGVGTYLFLGVIGALALFFLVALFLAYSGLLPDRKARRQRRKQTLEDGEDSFGDEVESVFDLDDFRERGREGLAAFRNRLRRPPRIEDMPDDAARVRFAYKALLASPLGEDTAWQTPLERSRSLDQPTLSAMSRDYSSVRYADAVPPGAGERAVEAVRALGRVKKKKQ